MKMSNMLDENHDLDDGRFLTDSEIRERYQAFDALKARLYADLGVVELSGSPALVFTE